VTAYRAIKDRSSIDCGAWFSLREQLEQSDSKNDWSKCFASRSVFRFLRAMRVAERRWLLASIVVFAGSSAGSGGVEL